MTTTGIRQGGCVVVPTQANLNKTMREKIEQAFARQFPRQYTSIMEIVPGSLKLHKAKGAATEFTLKANEYHGTFTGHHAVPRLRTFTGVYHPGNGHVTFKQVTQSQSGSGVAGL